MPNLDQTLAKMAERLGTKADTLWPQLVAIQKIEWFTDLAICAVCLGVSFILARYAIKRFRIDDIDGPAILSTVVSAVTGICGVVGLCITLSGIGSRLIYPEVGAAQSILQTRSK